MRKISLLLSLILLQILNASAYHDRSWNHSPQQDRSINASGCARATGSTTIEYNNVKALIHTGGDMWWDLVGTPKYEIPKGSGKTSLFAGAIWIGGTDVNDQLRLSAVKFRSTGVDYWPGPLIISGMNQATISPEICTEYDKHFVISRQEVAEFRSYINAVLSNNIEIIETQFEGYQVPDIISNWPGNGKSNLGYDFYLAPYYDADASGDYNPYEGGDYPFFDLDGTVDCGTSRELRKPRLYGDYNMWWVYNDKGNVHTETNGAAIGMEIRAQYFAFATADELNNMTFGNYALINRSTYTLYNTYFGVWTDADLGDPTDDYVGCDVTRGLGYLYNGDAMDGDGSNNTYGINPPAIGVDFFEGPYMDPLIEGGDTIDRQSAYLRDSEGNFTNVIDALMPQSVLYNGSINGLNFGDSIGGNERWGMRRFIYFNNDGSYLGDPTLAQQYYNYLDGKWKDGSGLAFGGNGYPPDPDNYTAANFMFPGITDPYNWGTNGTVPVYPQAGGWTEENENNQAKDKRFVQSAGPFTLLPGAVNDITVGMVWARASSGGAFESVRKVQDADDKAQRLFDACFKMLDGPDSPELGITGMDQELLFQIFNLKGQSNNYIDEPEDYIAEDIFIVNPPEIDPDDVDKWYRFEGYQVFQVAKSSVTTSDLDNPELSRLVFQCDVKNDVSTIINYEIDASTGLLYPKLKVSGDNSGIKHSFRITEDAFATSEKTLVNFKKYYYIAVSYAYNNFKSYVQTDGNSLDGRKEPYLRGRKSAKGSIKTFVGMPGKNMIQQGGVEVNSVYGQGIAVTMVEGMGNGNNYLNLTQSTIDRIMSGYPWKTDERAYEIGQGPIQINIVDPLNVKDEEYILKFDSTEYYTTSQNSYLSLSGYVKDANWFIYPKKFDRTQLDTTLLIMINTTDAKEVDTTLYLPMQFGIRNVVQSYSSLTSIGIDTFRVNGGVLTNLRLFTAETFFSEKPLTKDHEQIIPNIGLSVRLYQVNVPGPGYSPAIENINFQNGFLGSSFVYTDESKPWLSHIQDVSGESPYNWIRSGVVTTDGLWKSMTVFTTDYPVDRNDYWTTMANGLFSSYRLAMYDFNDGAAAILKYQVSNNGITGEGTSFANAHGASFDKYKRTPSIDVVITKDTNLWSRCPVIEMCEYDTVHVHTSNGTEIDYIAGPSMGGANKFQLRRDRSVHRNGKKVSDADVDTIMVEGYKFSTDSGMGWFPGYVIDVETGERLNVFFGEDSRWGAFNGSDMMWNPHHKEYTDLYAQTGGLAGDLVFGGKHNIYVWGHSFYGKQSEFIGSTLGQNKSNEYDEGNKVFALLKLSETFTDISKRPFAFNTVYNNVVYMARPMLQTYFSNFNATTDPYGFIASDVKIQIRMANPYRGKGAVTSTGLKVNTSTFLKPDSTALNDNAPMFTFSTKGLGANINLTDVAKSALDIINVVPNPYYSYNEYELKQTQKLVKFINLPEKCTISIYNLGGNLVRRYEKSDPLKYLDWNLENSYGIEVASGVYIIHIEVPGVGEKVLKWFGTLRPIDLNKI